jgi:DNA polymerase III delta prime subunit
MFQPYNVFNSAEFTDRNSEFERVGTILKEKGRGALIFEGERGSGKSTFLFELYRRLHEQSEIRPFLIGLFPYSADEFKEKENIWLNSERTFQKQDIPEVLNRLARSLEIDFIESDNRNFQTDYLARGLAYRASRTVPVLLVDSVYECPEEVRIEIEKYIFAPLLASERVFLILSGRGKRPIWSSPNLQTAEIIALTPLANNDVKEQLSKLEKAGKSKRDESEYDEIADLSCGYPLIVRVMAASEKKSLADALDEAIDIIIKDTLPAPEREEEKYSQTRPLIERLALVDIPFRITDVEEYLFPEDPEGRAKTNTLVTLLLASGLLRYKGKGYQLNQSVVYPIRKWLARKGQYDNYLVQLTKASEDLQKSYPSSKAWYQRMLPKEKSPSDHMGKSQYAA